MVLGYKERIRLQVHMMLVLIDAYITIVWYRVLYQYCSDVILAVFKNFRGSLS